MKKITAGILVFILLLNLIFFGLGMYGDLVFWLIIVLAFIGMKITQNLKRSS